MEKKQRKYYTIFAGRHQPQKVEFGHLNKDTGLPKGDVHTAMVAVGAVAIPNYSNVWGVLEKGKDGILTGKIKFMKWGEEGGGAVEIRFMPNSQSLSKQYQDTVVKLKPRDEDSEIRLHYGLNDFSYDTEGVLIEMLKHHSLNRDSESRDPMNEDFDFYEHDSDKKVDQKTERIEIVNKANQIILDHRYDTDSLAVLATIFDLDDRSQDSVIVDALLERVEKNPKLFTHIVTEAKQRAKSIVEKAVEYNLVDELSVPGEIQLRTGKGRAKLFTGIEGEDKVQWVADNYLTAGVYDGIKKLESVITEHETKNFD